MSTAIKKGGKVNYFHRPEDQKNSLHVAAEGGSLEVCKILLDNGAVVDALAITNKETALSLAASYGHTAIVQLLLDNGAQINVQNAYGNSPLHEAARHGFVKTSSILISHGASIRLKNNKGSVALHLACYGADKGDFPLELTNLLLKAGSDVNALDNRGCTALMAAASSGREDVINALLESGANGKLVDGAGMDALATSMFHKQSISLKLHKMLSKDGREAPNSVFGK